MSKIEVDAIDKQSGSTLTLGGSGTAVTLASGATQTGFGRTGTVNWVTTKKTTNFTAVSGEGYFCDTAASGAFTLTLPASPSAGDIVGLKDYNGNFSTANLTIGRNSEPINGGSSINPVISTSGATIFLVYVDGTQGWVATLDDSSSLTGEDFITATGGTITTSGNDKIHTFTGPGTFTVCSVSSTATNNLVSYLVVAGGGGGGGRDGGGGGGAGGFRELKSPVTPYTASPLDGYPSAPNRITVTATSFPITVGGGGTAGLGAPSPGSRTCGGAGSNSSFSTITGAGGGLGAIGANPGCTGKNGGNGGSGGGGGGRNRNAGAGLGGTGNTPPVSPSQGSNGGGSKCESSPSLDNAGGGGGATGVGGTASGTPGNAGTGGVGATTSISGSSLSYAGGGGGGSEPGVGAASPCGTGGQGARGDDSPSGNAEAGAGTTNRGGGGGGAAGGNGPANTMNGALGGSGIVIIRYKFQ